jgi:hypothetical protein
VQRLAIGLLHEAISRPVQPWTWRLPDARSASELHICTPRSAPWLVQAGVTELTAWQAVLPVEGEIDVTYRQQISP